MRKHTPNLGLVFFTLALLFALSPAVANAAAQDPNEYDSENTGGSGGETSGDPDMPDTNPGIGSGSQSGSGWYQNLGLGSRSPETSVGSGRTGARLWDSWRVAWQALRVMLGWV